MSQCRGYYTSNSSNSRSSSSPVDPPAKSSVSMPFIVNSEDDFEYDRSYINHNKRPFSAVENSNTNNSFSDFEANKQQKLNHYYSSTNNRGYSSSSSPSVASFSSSSSSVATLHSQNNESVQSQPEYVSSESSSMSPPYQPARVPVLSPELAAPVFQTADKCNEWELLKPVIKSSDDDITIRSENSEKWAWGTGNKWVGASGPRPKLNVYSGAPKIEMFTTARKVSGGIGEKLLQQMGWRQGEGLGKTKEGATEPIGFNEIKTDRKGLVSGDDAGQIIVNEKNMQEKSKSKYSQLKSTSFWNWHDSGMKGPENVNARIRNEKKAAKEKTLPTLDLKGKHPVSALMELCSKQKWKEPKFVSVIDGYGFKFKVEVNGKEYTPSNNCDTKKGAKAESAKTCLVELGWTL